LEKLADAFVEFPFIGCSAEVDAVAETQLRQMQYGSQFISNVNTNWESLISQGAIDTNNVMMIIGCSNLLDPADVNPICETDTIVRAASAALPRPELEDGTALPDYPIEYVDRVHFGSLVKIDTPSHETFELIIRFLEIETSGYDVPLMHRRLQQSALVLNLTKQTNVLVASLVDSSFVESRFSKDNVLTFSTAQGRKFEDVLHISDEPTGWWTAFPEVGEFDQTLSITMALEKKAYAFDEGFFVVDLMPGRPFVVSPYVLIPPTLPDLIVGENIVISCQLGSTSVCDDGAFFQVIIEKGAYITVRYSLENVGLAAGLRTTQVNKTTRTSFYLSTNLERDGTDIPLRDLDLIRSKVWKMKGQSLPILQRLKNVQIVDRVGGDQILPGTYNLIICADDKGDFESNLAETEGLNNCAVAPQQLLVVDSI